MILIVETVQFSDEALDQMAKGVSVHKLKNTKHVYYEKCIFQTTRIESVIPSKQFTGHVEIKTYTKEIYILKISVQQYAQLIDHVDAQKILCLRNN